MMKIILNIRLQCTIFLMVLVKTAAFVPLSASTSLSVWNVAIPPLAHQHARLNVKLKSLQSTYNLEDNQNMTTNNDDIEWKSFQLQSFQNLASVVLCSVLINLCLPANSKIANALPPLPESPSSSSSSLSSTILSMDATTVVSSPSSAPFIFNLRQSSAFQSLPRELPPPMQQAERQLRSIADLQDAKLAQCIDRGVYWEQCFMDGMRDDAKGIDYQWGSPEAALELKPSAKPSPFALLGNGYGDKDKHTINPRPPTW